MDLVGEFEAQRPRLFGIAYRMLGSAEEAEDVVQDAFLRWNAADETITTPGAWLAKVVTNLCLNRLASARSRREQYVGPWLPEPVLTTDGALSTADTVEQRELVSLGLLVLMEQLTPVERAVFVLREAFGYSHREIADIVEVSEENSRQLHRRARQHVGTARKVTAPDRAGWRRLVERFLAAAEQGDVAGLEGMLAADAVSWGDGGGKANAGRRPVLGRKRVARLVAGAYSKRFEGVDVRIAEVNGEIAVLGWAGDVLIGLMTVEVVDEQIVALRAVANPDKLRFVSRHFDGDVTFGDAVRS